MAQLTITATSSVTIDGRVVSQTSTYTADVRNFVQMTKDVTNTYEVASAGGGYAFILVENVGDEAVFVRMTTSGSKYIFFAVAAGCHIFIPGRTGEDNGAIDGIIIGQNLAVRSLTSAGSRVAISAGMNFNNV